MAMGSFVPGARPYGQGQPKPGQPPSPYFTYKTCYGYMHQEQMRAPPSQQYSNPIFPRSQYRAPESETGMGMAGGSGVQLPPIRPAPERSLIDPALAQQQRAQTQEQTSQGQSSSSDTTRQPDPKRPKMDIQGILGPRND